MDSHVDDNKLVLKKNGKSFYWAGKLLPKKDINRAAELYSFCRILDDIADSGEANSHKYLINFKSIIKKNIITELENIYSNLKILENLKLFLYLKMKEELFAYLPK